MTDDHDYVTNQLTPLLDEFEEKLKFRWQQTMYDCIVTGADIPQPLSPPPMYAPSRPSFQTPEVARHVRYDQCAFLAWYENGRQGKVTDIVCAGETMTSPIVCPIGDIFEFAGVYAYADRTAIFNELPLWADQQVAKLDAAWDVLRDMAADLGATNAADGFDVAFQTELGLRHTVEEELDPGSSSATWLQDWTGAAAEGAAKTIFDSTKPTLGNHRSFAKGLAQMINVRAHMIKTHRRNNCRLFEEAIKELSEKEEVETPDADAWVWKACHLTGTTLSVLRHVPGFPGVAGVGGDVLKLVGAVGMQWWSSDKGVTFRHKHGPDEVAKALYDDVQTMRDELARAYGEYRDRVSELGNAVNSIPSTYLELYDLTENSPTGAGRQHDNETYAVSAESLAELAGYCYEASDDYAEILRKFPGTDDARGQLTDHEGNATEPDQEIISLLDEFERYLRTTAARYHLAGERIEEAARRYLEAESNAVDQLNQFDRRLGDIAHDPDYDAPGRGGRGRGDADRDAADTRRPDEATDVRPDQFEESSVGS